MNESIRILNRVRSCYQTFSQTWRRSGDRPVDWLRPLRSLLNRMPVQSAKVAHRLCQLIPAQCPFERDITLFGHHVAHIPPLCKLNPLYEEVVALRFRALCYLADECGEDITSYC
jgi:hypothetical protein